ncbi:MAG: hypothetical protein FWD16_02125 [Clostridia bacterium]|nr:hypothetical protein [Clostridia bacterium]
MTKLNTPKTKIWAIILLLLATTILPGLPIIALENAEDEHVYPLGDLTFDGTVGIDDVLTMRDIMFGIVPSEAQLEQIKRLRPDGRPTVGVFLNIVDISTTPIGEEVVFRTAKTDINKIDITVSQPDTDGNQNITVSLKDYLPVEYLAAMQLNIAMPTELCTYVSHNNNFETRSNIRNNEFVITPMNFINHYYHPHSISKLCTITVQPLNGKELTTADFPIVCLEMFYDETDEPKPFPLFDYATGIWIKSGDSSIPSRSTIFVDERNRDSLAIPIKNSLGQSTYFAYDIGIKVDGKAEQPIEGKTPTIHIPTPPGLIAPFCSVFLADAEDGSLTDLDAVVDGDYISFQTEAFGTFIVAQPPKGDINRDFKVNIDDILYTRDIIFGSQTATDYTLWAVDAAKPGDINIDTILKLRDIIFNL